MKQNRIFYSVIILLIVLAMIAGCAGPTMPATTEPATTAPPTEQAIQTEPVEVAPPARFDPDNEKDSINWDKLEEKFGPMPQPSKQYKIGSVMKFMGNPYWQLLAKGMEDQAKKYGMTFEVQAAQSEADQSGQLANMETMLEKGFDALLVSPQTDTNLVPAIEKARQMGILIVNVDDAVLEDAEHFVGPNQYENGINAAKYFIQEFPEGGKVAVIEGQAGVYAAKQRTKGFKDTLTGTKFEVVASVPGDWDRQKSLDAATTILQQHPDLKGFYCNNDTMALGVVEAVKNANKLGEVLVIGTDGIGEAYDSIRAKEMTGTVDSFPELTGNVAVDVALRLLEGQAIPRAVFSPQNLIVLANVDNPLESPFKEAGAAQPGEVAAGRFDPDNEKDSINWDKLEEVFGPVPTPDKELRIGSVMKFMGNPYWQLLARGMEDQAKKYGMTFEVQAAQSEADQSGQLANMETMLEKGFDAFLLSPQTDTNLVPAVEKARAAGILLVNVDDAVLEDAEHFVGPNQYENGIRAANYFLHFFPGGGKVAVIEGQAGVYAAKQRTKGFKDTLEGSNIEVVASVPGDWDRQKSLDAATTILQQHPDLLGFYCNNDTMALGVVEAVRNAGKLGKVVIIGTDGIGEAYDSIRAGEMTGTVDSFPELTGNVAVDVALRLLMGQPIPRAVFSPQNLITLQNINDPLAPPY